jgi:DNA-binding GntR family transcriptional regulator
MKDSFRWTPSNPLQRSRLADQAFAALHTWIMDGTLKPGSHLRVRELAAALGSSMMPVREALTRLVESGLAVHQPHRGAVVAGLSLRELEDCYGVRILLESEAARLGTTHISAAGIQKMRRSWRALKKAVKLNQIPKALKVDEDCLKTLYAASNNSYLVKLIQSAWDRTQPYKMLWASTAHLRGGPVVWHHKAELLDAVEAHDSGLAASITRGSLVKARAELARLIQSGLAPGDLWSAER